MPDPSKSVLYPIKEVFHDPYLEIILRLGSVFRSKSKTAKIVMSKIIRVRLEFVFRSQTYY